MSKKMQLIEGHVQAVKFYTFGEDEKKQHIALVTIEDKTFEIGHMEPDCIETNDEIICVASQNRFGLYSCFSLYNKTKQQYKKTQTWIYFILGVMSVFMGGLFTLWAIQEIKTYGFKEAIPEMILPLIFLPIGVTILYRLTLHLKAKAWVREKAHQQK